MSAKNLSQLLKTLIYSKILTIASHRRISKTNARQINSKISITAVDHIFLYA